jgi:hypothetical protein
MKHFGASRAELECPVVDHESDEMGANGFTVECLSFRSREASCKPRVGYRALSGNLLKHLCARNRAWIFHFVQSAQRFRFIFPFTQRHSTHVSCRPQSLVRQGVAGNPAPSNQTRVR